MEGHASFHLRVTCTGQWGVKAQRRGRSVVGTARQQQYQYNTLEREKGEHYYPQTESRFAAQCTHSGAGVSNLPEGGAAVGEPVQTSEGGG